MKINLENICLIILFLCFIIMIGLLIISAYIPKSIETYYCEKTGGTMWMYECYNSIFNSSCDKVKTGLWCEYPDGRSLSYNNISKIINSTMLDTVE